MVFRNRLKEDTKEQRHLTDIRTLSKKKEFKGEKVPSEVISQCFNFAYSMAEGQLHRETRTGGEHSRTQLEVFWDTFRGKIAESFAYFYYKNLGVEISDLDFNIYPRGKWDSFDMTVNGNIISVKSTKHFGQLLLLEFDDWNGNGHYVPDPQINYDYFILVRTKIKSGNDFDKGNLPDKTTLSSYCLNLDIEGEITGALSHKDFVNQIIKFKYIIKKGQLLQGKIPMDATNYYVHAGDLEDPKTIL
ncbi:hypothetical protein HCC09_07870 [Streptococcus suis]|nr:hypothetical protein [Streptococcus suis]